MKSLNFTFLFSLLILCALSITSCGDDDNGSSNGDLDCNSSVEVNNAVSAEAKAVSDAVSAWGMDPSDANCAALKTAYVDYIDALNDLLECARDAGIGPDFTNLISVTESSIDGLIC